MEVIMAMEINGQNYGSYAVQNRTANDTSGSAKKSETEKAAGTAGISETDNARDAYMRTLEKLAPSVKFGTGYGLSAAKKGKTLTINPKILEKMQRDPEQEKEMKELIRGVETAMKLSQSITRSRGMKTVFSHWYIDENGKCWHTALTVSDDRLSKKLRQERKENSEKLIEKTKEKAAKKKEELEELLEETSVKFDLQI